MKRSSKENPVYNIKPGFPNQKRAQNLCQIERKSHTSSGLQNPSRLFFLDKLTKILLPARTYSARILSTGGELRKPKVISQRKGSDLTNQQGLRKPGAGLAKWHSLLACIADEKTDLNKCGAE